MKRNAAISATEFTPEVYKSAAAEHIVVAAELYESGRYVLASFVAGLAVESLFRGYRCRISPEFDARHDIHALYRLSRFAVVVPQSRVGVYGEMVGSVAARWSSSHRYRSHHAFARWLKRLKLDRGIKGDPVKENTRRLLNAASELVSLGVKQWSHWHPG